MRLGRFEHLRMPELRPWRCHVRAGGIGRVLAREVVMERIERYLVRFEADGVECWVEAARVAPAASSVVPFARRPDPGRPEAASRV